MSRDPSLYLEEILGAADAVAGYLSGLDYELTSRHAAVEWRRIAGMRDMLVHQYFSTDLEIVWDAAANRLPAVRVAVQAILDSLQ